MTRADENSTGRGDSGNTPINKVIEGRATQTVLNRGNSNLYNKSVKVDKIENSDSIESIVNKDNALKNLIHDLRSPLNAIVGYGEILQEEDLSNEERIEYAKNLVENAYKNLTAINSFHDLTRMESGVFNPQYETFNLADLLKNTASSIAHDKRYADRKPQITIDIAPDTKENLTNYSADKNMIDRLLTNAMTNALEAPVETSTDKDVYDGQVHVFVYQTEHNGKDMYSLVIHNNGVVPESARENFFEKFVTSKENGTGLGTAMMKNIVDVHGGDIEMITKEGYGTDVKIYLPINNPQA